MMSTPIPPSDYASLGERVLARLLDGLFSSVPSIVALASIFVDVEAASTIIIVAYPISFLFALYNLLWLGGRRGQTLGRRVMGVWVLRADTGQPLGTGSFFARELVLGLVVGLTCYIAAVISLIVAAGDPRRQAWHDKAVRSVVLRHGPQGPALAAVPQPAAAGVLPVGLPPVPPPPGEAIRVSPAPRASVPASTEPVAAPVAPAFIAREAPHSSVPVAPSGLVPPPPGIVTPTPGLAAQPPAPPSTAAPADFDPQTRAVKRTSGWRLAAPDGQTRQIVGGLLIGRDPEVALVEGAAPWAVNDPELTVSKTHALVGLSEGAPFVEDHDSTNGVVIVREGAEIELKPRQRTSLKAEDKLLLGDFEFTVHGNA